MDKRKLNRRDFLRISGAVATGAILAACAPAPTPVVIEKEVVKEVPVEKPVIVEKEVVKEVPVEKVIEKEVPKVIEVEKQVVVEKLITPTPKPAEKIELRWSDWAGKYEEVAKISIEKFRADHPNITISYEPQPEGWFERTVAAMVAGTSPDIIMAWGLWFYKFYQKRQSLDLAPYVERDWTEQYIEENFVPQQWKAFWKLTFGAPFLTALPRYINHMFLHYNKDALKEAGVDFPDETWTMDDLAIAAKKLIKRKPDGTIKQFGGNFPSWAMERMFYHLNKWGGGFVNPDDPTDCILDRPESQEAAEWMRVRYWVDESYGQPLVTGKSWGGEVFKSGLCATIQEGFYPWDMATPEQMPWDWNITHEPSGPKKRVSYITTDGWMVWRETKYPDAAWEFMKWITGPIHQKIQTETFGLIPANRKIAYEWPKILRGMFPRLEKVNMEVVPQALDMGYATDDERFLMQFEAEEIINPLLEKVYITGGTPVSVLADACAKVEAAQKVG